MSKKKNHRGRPKDNDEAPIKFELKSKDHTGEIILYSFDRKLHNTGTVSVEILEDVREYKKPDLNPKQTYAGKAPVVIVWKSKRKNAKPKMKIWTTKNLDDVLTNEQAGIPKNAEILELAVGESFIETYKSQYNL